MQQFRCKPEARYELTTRTSTSSSRPCAPAATPSRRRAPTAPTAATGTEGRLVQSTSQFICVTPFPAAAPTAAPTAATGTEGRLVQSTSQVICVAPFPAAAPTPPHDQFIHNSTIIPQSSMIIPRYLFTIQRLPPKRQYPSSLDKPAKYRAAEARRDAATAEPRNHSRPLEF